jgi:tetratricopeptide (TPR) repeat protein
MSLLKKMFGKRDPLAQMRHFHAQQNWASAFTAASKIDRQALTTEERDEVSAIEQRAGDELARLNLSEGEGEVANGNLMRALDHYQLARNQARSPELIERAAAAITSVEKNQAAPVRVTNGPDASSCGSSCHSTCGPTAETSLPSAADSLDEEARFEILLATLPAALADRYASSGEAFRKAWLATHEEEAGRVLELFNRVPEDERDALFFYERGAVEARSQDYQEAYRDLSTALQFDPELFPAFEAMISLLTDAGRLEELETLLRSTIENGRFQGYCWSVLARQLLHKGEEDAALDAGGRALASGDGVSLETVVLCAQLLERRQRFDEAEALLKQLPVAGCGGGAHPLLAEFWLRRSQNLDRALESFKGALRQEQENPRWPLRIAQAYLARGWISEAAAQLDRLMARGGLPESILTEIRETSERLRDA